MGNPNLHLTKLPEELLRAILSHSYNFESLESAVKSCHAFHGAFKAFPGPIVADVVLSRVCHSVVPYVVARLEAARYDGHAQKGGLLERAKDVTLRCRDEKVSKFEWSLTDGIAAARFHDVIVRMARDLAAGYISRLSSYTGANEDAASDAELNRIQGALYRFEIFRLLIPSPRSTFTGPFSDAEVEQCQEAVEAKLALFSPYTHWENEQLGAVYESIFLRVAAIYNDMVLHDIAWGWNNTYYVDEMHEISINFILRKGLQYINSLLEQTTYEGQIKILGSKLPPIAMEFLGTAFSDLNQHWYDMRRAGHDTMAVYKADELPARGAVDDPGPKKSWMWAYADNLLYATPMEPYDSCLRACGYVFWDADRWTKNGFLETEYIEMVLEDGEPILENGPNNDELERSWQLRSELYRQGYRGYWREDDDSGYSKTAEPMGSY